MATFNHISGAEPSTVTFKAATVSMTRNSSLMHQEIVSLGDPDSSLAVSAVLNAQPASTAWGLVTRPVISSIGGVVSIQGNSTVFQGGSPWNVAQVAGSTWSVRAQNSSAADLQATVAQASTVWAVQLTQYSTTVNVSSLGGAVIVRSSAANALVTVYQSSAADLQATVAQASTVWAVQLTQWSTTHNVSSLAGRVQVAPTDTNWASSAGFHFDGSGNLLTAGGAGGSSQVTISQVLDSSGGGVVVADSANNAIRVNVVAGAAGGSTIVTVSTGSVRVHQSTAADLQATVGQASTVWAVQLTQYSTIVAVSSLGGAVIVRSSAANALGTVYQSTAADLQATVTQASTVWQVQIHGDSTVAPLAGSTWATRPIQSSAADLQVTATIGDNLQSTTTPSTNSSGLIVRQALPHIFTTASTNAFASTTLAIQSSAANTRMYVTAYSITTTSAGPTALSFRSSGTLVWPIILAAVSSAVSGVNLAVPYPSYLFRTIGGSDALNLHTQGATGGGFRVGVSYFKSS